MSLSTFKGQIRYIGNEKSIGFCPSFITLYPQNVSTQRSNKTLNTSWDKKYPFILQTVSILLQLSV